MVRKLKETKFLAMVLTIALCLNIVGIGTASANPSSVPLHPDPYEEGLLRYQQDLREESLHGDSQTLGVGAIIKALTKVVFKELAKKTDDVIVKATKKEVKTKLKNHAIRQAVQRGVTEIMIDNILSEISSGMKAILKFDDVIGNSRIMYDPNSKLTVVLSKFENILITTYIDEDNTMANRVKKGRWKAASWIFK
ncbi:hypothetical protein [Paenibacillus apiarius]|uniref:DUF4258 domain-containing protein n=1 Tax=Paenibacillus apiarius TaxID=46240 RepID=A0ABT4E0S3_9BACL|nr:hypothetical protein [Paenibacillus apiarius]MCY9516758.1 DUF4258 domain-containing protein [Paenibacillus apiarius]MCY9523199.1 DUF4258 domain-containing protein [Paenibacillus apiarius]MCY9553182.1 DUF4258 domain-containing protein [Paenibacillus apiarius]MCY9559624.1 DUF4258 domain-containing protein [Paenibacillus apiarius]MCY9686532.1 DUF4258 domain-containing protein [Paenibacillus apiarius]